MVDPIDKVIQELDADDPTGPRYNRPPRQVLPSAPERFRPFLIQITGTLTGGFAWKEEQFNLDGTISDVEDGRTNVTAGVAVEGNGITGFFDGMIVLVVLRAGSGAMAKNLFFYPLPLGTADHQVVAWDDPNKRWLADWPRYHA